MSNDLIIRRMQAAELEFAARSTADEGWASENLAALEGFYQHDPDGCLLADHSGQPVGICIATSYGHCGFFGELIVRPHARGQGIGAALLKHAVAHLHEHGAETVYLDGVVKAVRLYERGGFRKICRSLRFSGALTGAGIRVSGPCRPTTCRLYSRLTGRRSERTEVSFRPAGCGSFRTRATS